MQYSLGKNLSLALATAVIALPGAVVADDTFPFPSAGSTVIGSIGFIDAEQIGFFWSVARGDQVSETFTSTCSTGVIEGISLDLEVLTNVLGSGAFVDWDISVNGELLGDITVPEGFTGAVMVPLAGVVDGPDFELLMEVTNEVAPGQGSHSLAYVDPYLHSVTLECLGAYASVGGKTVCTGGNESGGDGDGNGQYDPISACDGPAYWVTDSFISGFIGLTSDTATGDPESFPYSGTPVAFSELSFREKDPSRGNRCVYTPSPTSVATIDEDQTVLSGGWLLNCWDADDVQYIIDGIEDADIILTNGTGAGKGRDKDRGSVCFGLAGSGVCADPVLANYTLARGSVDSGQE